MFKFIRHTATLTKAYTNDEMKIVHSLLRKQYKTVTEKVSKID